MSKYEIKNSECEKLLSFTLEWKLNFDDYFSDTCKKAPGKLNVFPRNAPFIGLSKRCIPMNAFF